MHRLGVLGAQAHYHYVGWLRDQGGCEVIGLYEPDAARAEPAARFMGCPLVDDEAILGAPDVDLVFIGTDPCDKADTVERAAAAGKQILMDKPWPADFEAMERMRRAVEAAGVALVVPFPHGRYNPNLGPLAEQVRDGALGTLDLWDHTFTFHSPAGSIGRDITPPKPPQVSTGGELVNLGCYALDLLVSALGLPSEVRGRIARRYWPEYAAAGTEDLAEAWLTYRETTAHLVVARNVSTGDGFRVNRLHLASPGWDVLMAPYEGLHKVNGQDRPMADNATETAACGGHFLACAEGREQPRSGVEAGLQVTELTVAIYQAAASGTAVSLPLRTRGNPYLEGWKVP